MTYMEIREILNLLVPIERDASVFARGTDNFFKETNNNTQAYEVTRKELLDLNEILMSNLTRITEVIETINKAPAKKITPVAEKKAIKK